MDAFVIKKLVQLIKVDIFRIQGDVRMAYQDSTDMNPIWQSESLRMQIMEGAAHQNVPYICRDDFGVYYACIKKDDAYYLIGPMATEYLNRVRRHEYYRVMGIELDLDKNLHIITVEEVLQTVSLLSKLLIHKEFEDGELVQANNLLTESKEKVYADAFRYSHKIEEDEEDYRHSYQEERRLLDAVREGNVAEALKRNKEMDVDIGKLSNDELSHWRNVLVIGATLCARAAIEGGVTPYNAYRISGYYINKGSNSHDVLQILSYRNQAVAELAKAVETLKVKRHTSSYTQQCKDYVRRHFREKIYLEDIAEQLGISSSYLSRIFKKETGQNLQDYIVDIRVERATNLLIYSEESIPRIASYVNFPSQSYFGRVFKERKHMTPREYREAYKPTEFIERRDEN